MTEIEDEGLLDNERTEKERRENAPSGQKDLVRLLKPIVISEEQGKAIDSNVVSAQFYNCFNYSLISKDRSAVNLTVGITSPNPGEGKTLVASNLAVSLAVANQRDTVLVDLNIHSPEIHSIFGTRLTPGLVEAIHEPKIYVSKTQIKHLYVLSAGNITSSPWASDRGSTKDQRARGSSNRSSIGLDQVAGFRDVLYSLKEEFEFVIVDMPALQEPRIPILLTHQMDGLLVIVDARKTKQKDVENILRRVNSSQIIGFVFNRVGENSVRY
jgi:Mrp family chromosome partitioning ATPase